MFRLTDRRRRRSINTTQALCYQLDMSRRAAKLRGIVLSDEDGVCLAAAGDTDACDEVAARLPLVGRKVPEFEGILLAPEQAWDVVMRRFQVHGAPLFVCAIGGSGDKRARTEQLDKTIGGASRILAPAA